jgi:probable HAF family extracellular repeat protein
MQTSARWAAVGARLGVFPPTAPWWSAGLTTPKGVGVPFAGRRRAGCKTSARWAAIIAMLLMFPPMAPWWSAGLGTAQGLVACLSLDGVGRHARPRHAAGRHLEQGLWCFRRRRRGGRRGFQRRRAEACLSLDGVLGMQDLGTLGGSESYAYDVSADGAVVVGVARNAAGYGRAFRWTASGGMQDLGTLGGTWSEAFGVSADGSVVVGWAGNAAGYGRAFRWTASGGMEDLNTTYASLLTNGSVLWQARPSPPMDAILWGGLQRRHKALPKPSCWIRASRQTRGCRPQRLRG